MTDKPKTPDPETIIELVSVIDWRYVAAALVVGGLVVFALLAVIEHTDDIPAIDPGE